MTEILLDKILKGYRPECRILKSANLEYPTVKGKFLIGPPYYFTLSSPHATDIEIQLCLNQLCYAGISEAIKIGLIPELKGLNFEELQKENMLIIESRKRFRKPIRTDKEVYGEARLKEWKIDDKLIRGWVDFQFENRSCFGNLEVVVIKP